MNDHYETEVKLYIPDLTAVMATLNKAGAVLASQRVHEHNIRYDNAAHSLATGGIVLRLRRDDRVRLTYKEAGSAQDGIIRRLEAEVEVSDFETMDFILKKLGYSPSMSYEKYRTTYMLDDAEIVLDELPYGNFVEIEGNYNSIQATLTRLNLQAASRMTYSYARLFDFVRANLGLSFHDLTFANFAGITVPFSAFTPSGQASSL